MDATMHQKAYFIQLVQTLKATASGIMPTAAITNTAYFIPQSVTFMVEKRDVIRLKSCTVGISFFTNTLYSDMLSFGT